MSTALQPRPAVAAAPAQPAAKPMQRRYRARSRRRGFNAGLLTFLAWLSVAVAVALYLAYGGFHSLTSIGGVATAVGITIGLVATDLMCIMLLLAARIPFIDRSIGHDRAIAVHSKLGEWVLYGLLLHGWFLVLGYSLSDQVTLLNEWDTLWSISDFKLAVLGLGLLLVVGITSVVAVKKKMSYEVWHVIHLMTYLAVAVSLPHQFSLGGLFGEDTWQRTYWIGLFAVVALAILAFRVFLPIFSTLEHGLRVTRVIHEAPDVVTIEMTGKNLPKLNVAAGQFLSWRFLAKGLWWHQHPFSVSAAPTATSLRITVRALGKGTAALMNVRPGTRVAIEGPYGIFSDAARTTDGVTLVGIGIGIAPIRAILEDTAIVPGKATVILRASTPAQLYLRSEIERLCQAKGARLVMLVGERGVTADGGTHWVPAWQHGLTLADFVPDVASTDVYVCGPQAASDSVIADAIAAGTAESAIHNERFVW